MTELTKSSNNLESKTLSPDLANRFIRWARSEGGFTFDSVTYDDRDVWFTTLPGQYGEPAGYIITIEGTPPKAMLHVFETDSDWECLLIIGSRRIRGGNDGGVARPRRLKWAMEFIQEVIVQ